MHVEEWSWRVEDAIVEIDEGLWQIDLGFQGRRGIISAYLLRGQGRGGAHRNRAIVVVAASRDSPAAWDWNWGAFLARWSRISISIMRARQVSSLARIQKSLCMRIHSVCLT